MLTKLKKDLFSSIVVFLVALPLCLGVALASGAPLLSGIVSGIVGGIIVGLFSKSQTSVSGPAAGLTSVVLSGITELGTFEIFLTAVIIAGMIQLALGFLKVGFFADYIPTNVIKGLLAAIGIILILKQIPHAIGFDRDPEGDFSFFQYDGETTFSELGKAFKFLTPGAVLISFLSILMLIYWEKSKLSQLKKIPVSLVVVVLGVVLNEMFQRFFPFLAIENSHLVQLPTVHLENISSIFYLPDLSSIKNHKVWMIGLVIAVVASIETLLNIEAVDKLDPEKRQSPPNRELIAQGIGNIASGFFGGIPVTSVIVRSSVNIQSGNQSKKSAIFHGIFILLGLLFFSSILNLIPLSSLAAILLITGYKLAKVSLFKEMYNKGREQFYPFILTVIVIVFTDLLIGVFFGLTAGIFYVLRSNFRNPFVKEENVLHIGEVIKLELPNQVTFINKASIKNTLYSIPENSKIIIDASSSDFIDYDVMELIDDFKNVVAIEKNISLNVIGLKSKYDPLDYIQFINVLDKDTQQKLSPIQVLELLKIGNERFYKGKWSEKYLLHQVNATSMGQNPMAVILSCIDSRTSPEIIFDAGLGDLLSIRIAGNIVNPEIIGSMELAVMELGAKLIVILGHASCGAVAASIAGLVEHNLESITGKIQKAVTQCGCSIQEKGNLDPALTEKIIRQNVKNSIEDLLNGSSFLRDKIANKEVGIVGAYHDILTGKIEFEKLVE